MSPAKKKRFDLARLPAATGEQLDERFQGATPLRRLFNKVFPDHWSFLLGEIALYSFIVLLLTGTFLALFFDPSMAETRYQGSFAPLRGIEMTQAYATSLNLSFDVRGGLIMRQMHHWAALLFMAAIVVHMFRVFFTGAFRKPREANWIIGVLLFWLGFTEGFAGYSLPDDALSGTGLRIAFAIMLSIPVVGSWVATSLFGGEFPGTEILPRLYILHVFLVPLILLALITVHMGLLVKQKHTQFPGPGRTNHNVVGVRMFPTFAMKAGGFFMLVFGVIALMGGLVQINPIWLFGPYEASVVSAGSQPDWYVMFLDGSTRLMPDWDLQIGGYTIPTGNKKERKAGSKCTQRDSAGGWYEGAELHSVYFPLISEFSGTYGGHPVKIRIVYSPETKLTGKFEGGEDDTRVLLELVHQTAEQVSTVIAR